MIVQQAGAVLASKESPGGRDRLSAAEARWVSKTRQIASLVISGGLPELC